MIIRNKEGQFIKGSIQKGLSNPFYGKKHSLKSRKKISTFNKKNPNKTIFKKGYLGYLNYNQIW